MFAATGKEGAFSKMPTDKHEMEKLPNLIRIYP